MNQPNPRTASYDAIRAYAEQQSGSQNDAAFYPLLCGCMSAFVRLLCSERDSLRRDLDHLIKPREGAMLQVAVDEAEAWIEYEYSVGDPGRLSGPPEHCYPPEPEQIEILGVWLNGQWVSPTIFRDDIVERWCDRVREHEAEQREADAERAIEEQWS